MIKDGMVTTNGWLFVVFLFLVVTTPFNPFIVHKYLPIFWYIGVGIYALWLFARITREEGVR